MAKSSPAATVIKRTHSEDPDFLLLVKSLDKFLAVIDGDEHVFYATLNKLKQINAVVIYHNGTPIACGAIRPYDNTTMEVKRMFVLPSERGKGYAKQVLKELETWSSELGCHRCLLETGTRQPEAINLYSKMGYTKIPCYGQYNKMLNSICFEKILN